MEMPTLLLTTLVLCLAGSVLPYEGRGISCRSSLCHLADSSSLEAMPAGVSWVVWRPFGTSRLGGEEEDGRRLG